jgi:hypothetical protein
MKNKIVVVIAAALVGVPIAEAMSAGPTDASAPVGNRPAKTEAISGTNIKKITLTEKAAQRLDIKTVDVRQDASVKDGPAAGVKVVTVGVPELYGAERGVGH